MSERYLARRTAPQACLRPTGKYPGRRLEATSGNGSQDRLRAKAIRETGARPAPRMCTAETTTPMPTTTTTTTAAAAAPEEPPGRPIVLGRRFRDRPRELRSPRACPHGSPPFRSESLGILERSPLGQPGRLRCSVSISSLMDRGQDTWRRHRHLESIARSGFLMTKGRRTCHLDLTSWTGTSRLPRSAAPENPGIAGLPHPFRRATRCGRRSLSLLRRQIRRGKGSESVWARRKGPGAILVPRLSLQPTMHVPRLLLQLQPTEDAEDMNLEIRNVVGGMTKGTETIEQGGMQINRGGRSGGPEALLGGRLVSVEIGAELGKMIGSATMLEEGVN
mmetsp:Transcript_2255/g.5148  ORF Transcript_2255/g.5148 Transcript_2255/m.5148 type:complete len:335 (-) Transcript_2255:148-1152(-)